VAALHRVCLDKTLFLPSFPISNMSDLEIEKAEMGPRRWIELCSSFEKQDLDDNDNDNGIDNGVILRPQATRIINDLFATEVDYVSTYFFMVPGGRYLVSSLLEGISVLDLGYTSSSDCKLIASVGVPVIGGVNGFIAQVTPDGMGLTIFFGHIMGKSPLYYDHLVYWSMVNLFF
jgi:hypothetical protein